MKAPDYALRWPKSGMSLSEICMPNGGPILDFNTVIFPGGGALLWVEEDTLHILGSELKSYKGEWKDRT